MTTAKRATKKKAAGQLAKRATKKSAKGADRRTQEGSGVLLEDLRVVRFAGVALGGGKTDKTATAVIDYYPEQKRIFLRSLREKVSGKGELTADEVLHQLLTEEEDMMGLSSIAFDVPLQLPVCVRCELICPGAMRCVDPVVEWMREVHHRRAKDKRPNKMFTPYTERAAEIFIAHELEEPFHPNQALGSNAAPLTARAHFLRRRIKTPLIEVFPKLSLWRIGLSLGVAKSHLRFHKHAVDSDETRLIILQALINKDIAFIYQQDLKTMVENNHAFEAFVAALTAFLKFRGQTVLKPKGFPKEEMWIDFPVDSIRWF